MNRLTARERFLIFFLTGAAFLLIHWIVGEAVVKRASALRAELAAKRAEIQLLRTLAAGESSWAARDAWIAEAQPKLTDPEQAGVRLLDQMKETARASEAVLENPELGEVETRAACKAVSVQVTVKGSWSGLVRFLHALQPPERFLVLESATLLADGSDPNRMTCQLKIAQWYAL